MNFKQPNKFVRVTTSQWLKILSSLSPIEARVFMILLCCPNFDNSGWVGSINAIYRLLIIATGKETNRRVIIEAIDALKDAGIIWTKREDRRTRYRFIFDGRGVTERHRRSDPDDESQTEHHRQRDTEICDGASQISETERHPPQTAEHAEINEETPENDVTPITTNNCEELGTLYPCSSLGMSESSPVGAQAPLEGGNAPPKLEVVKPPPRKPWDGMAEKHGKRWALALGDALGEGLNGDAAYMRAIEIVEGVIDGSSSADHEPVLVSTAISTLG